MTFSPAPCGWYAQKHSTLFPFPRKTLPRRLLFRLHTDSRRPGHVPRILSHGGRIALFPAAIRRMETRQHTILYIYYFLMKVTLCFSGRLLHMTPRMGRVPFAGNRVGTLRRQPRKQQPPRQRCVSGQSLLRTGGRYAVRVPRSCQRIRDLAVTAASAGRFPNAPGPRIWWATAN